MIPSKGVSIALVMKFTVLIALNLALLRVDVWILQSPLILFVLVALDLVLARAVILGRPLRAFDYTFLAVGIVMAIVLTLAAYGKPVRGPVSSLHVSLHVVETVLGLYRLVSGETTGLQSGWRGSYPEPWVLEAERFVASGMVLVTAWAAGLLVAWRLRRRSSRPEVRTRRVARFFQGALIGFAFQTVVAGLCFSYRQEFSSPHTAGWNVLMGSMAACTILGGTVAVMLSPSGPPRTEDVGPDDRDREAINA